MRISFLTTPMLIFVHAVVAKPSSVSFESLQEISDNNVPDIDWENDDVESMARMIGLSQIIYPGTKYCGLGNIADTYIPPEKYLAAEDACCKGHDECQNYIPAGVTDPVSGLTNNCYISQSDCTCEDTFFKCLKNIGSTNANIIGRIYFSGMMRKCYTNTLKPLKCTTGIFWSDYQPTTCRTCYEYCTDETAAPAYHWRPTELYSNSNTVLTSHPPC